MTSPKPEQYPVLCAWCNTTISHSSVENSSGICLACAEILRSKIIEQTKVESFLRHKEAGNIKGGE